MKTTQILIAGFGGQGILFSGKFLAYKGLMENVQLSWLPSYGPEMRGGTANCNIILSDTPVGSPIITTPDVLIAMSKSFSGFLKDDGTLIISGIIDSRKDEVLDTIKAQNFELIEIREKEDWVAASFKKKC